MTLNSKLPAIVMLLVIGAIVYELGTQTRTMRVNFSYNPQNSDYFADANLPLAIKNVSLHVNFTTSVIPKMTMRIVSNGVPIQIIQGDFRIDSSTMGELLAALKGLNGKSITLYLSFEPDLSTVSLPYLEVQYVPLGGV